MNFNVSQSGTSAKQNEIPTFVNIPTGNNTAVNDKSRLEANQLLKSIIDNLNFLVMYSDNSTNRTGNVNVQNIAPNNFGNNFQFEAFGNSNINNPYVNNSFNNNPYNNMPYINQQKQQSNLSDPFNRQFNNLNINSNSSNNTWNNNFNNNWANNYGNNQGFNSGNNNQGGFDINLGNKNLNKTTGFNLVNNSATVQQKFNDVNFIIKLLG